MKRTKSTGFWNKNFLLLWQGQLISDLGNAAFDIALGFWVLEKTNSTGMMGLIMACFAAPVVILGPFSGAVADRMNRKIILVIADLIRGILFLTLGFLVVSDNFVFGLIFPIAIISGICASFFTPAVSAAVPDLVSADNLTRANSANSLSQGLSRLLGNSFGGLLYALLTAPVLFIIDGISFLYAAVSQAFIKLPSVSRTSEKKHILAEMMDGLKYVLDNKGLKKMLLACMLLNFFATMGLTLFTPLFSQTKSLGVTKYGFVMGAMMLGGILSMVLLSIFKIKPEKRYWIFVLAIILMDLFMILTGFSYNFIPMLILAFCTGAFNIIVNIIFQTVIQMSTPHEYLGKVFGIISALSGALSPIAMAVSGFAAQFMGVRNTIIACFIIAAVSTIPIILNSSLKEFINYNESENKSEISEAV